MKKILTLGSHHISDFLKDDERVKFYKIDTLHPWGHEQRNYFITDIKCNDTDWCYFLDDDNIITWDLISTYNEEKNSETDFVLFSQKSGLTEKIRLYGDNENRLGLGLCDIASFMIRYRLIKKHGRFRSCCLEIFGCSSYSKLTRKSSFGR